MAKKSKTQKAKASARRAEKKIASETVIANSESTTEKDSKLAAAKKNESTPVQKKTKKETAKPKKKSGIVSFFLDVKAELKRVTWPTRRDVMQWSGVVIVALLFFGIYVAILDSAIITPLLVVWSSLGIG